MGFPFCAGSGTYSFLPILSILALGSFAGQTDLHLTRNTFMLIVVSGLDTYRSLERARFLESAYREKYDPSGSSIERLTPGKDAVDPLLSIAVSGSLFSTRRFIRADGIISSCPKAKRDALMKALSHDADTTIVVCREEGVLKDADLKGFASLAGFKHDQFDLLGPSAFYQWAKDRASAIDYSNDEVIRRIADRSRGDAWSFISELGKVACGGDASSDLSDEVNGYAVIDALAESRRNSATLRASADDDDGVIALAPQQARALMLIRSGNTAGIHPFVVQKSRRLACSDSSLFFERVMTAFIWSRSGIANAEESLDVLF